MTAGDVRARRSSRRTAATDPTAPLVVLLHGRGSDEQRDPRPRRRTCRTARRTPRSGRRSPRAAATPGSPTAASAARSPTRCAATMDWFRTWLDEVAPAGRPVLLVGFSGGAAFAGGLVLDDPARYAGAAILYGTLPFDAGVPTDPGRLADLPVFVAQGDADHVIPRELLDRTWRYLLAESGAPTVAHRDRGGHRLTGRRRSTQLGDWIAHRLALVTQLGAAPAGAPRRRHAGPRFPAAAPRARGPAAPRCAGRSRSSRSPRTRPPTCRSSCFDEVRALPGVDVGPSHISVPGARGFTLREGSARRARHSWSRRSGSSRTCTRRTTARCTWSCRPTWPPTSSARAGADRTCGPASRLSPGFVMVYGPRDRGRACHGARPSSRRATPTRAERPSPAGAGAEPGPGRGTALARGVPRGCAAGSRHRPGGSS